MWKKKAGGIAKELHHYRCDVEKVTDGLTVLRVSRAAEAQGPAQQASVRIANVKLHYASSRRYSTFPWTGTGTGRSMVRFTSRLEAKAEPNEAGKFIVPIGLNPAAQTAEAPTILVTDGGSTIYLEQHPSEGALLAVQSCSVTDVAAIADTYP